MPQLNTPMRRPRRVASARRAFTPFACGLFLLLLASDAAAQRPVLVSIKNNDVTGGSGRSEQPSVSASGRYVAFESTAFDLAGVTDTNSGADIFVRDQQTGVTVLVSVNSAGNGTGNRPSTKPFISADGRYVVFQSDSGTLTPNDGNTTTDVFLRDLQAGTTTLLSAAVGGASSGNSASSDPVISANGRVVVFHSFASNLVPGDTNGATDVFAYDVQTGTTSLVSANTAGAAGNDSSFMERVGYVEFYRRVLSDDGRFVVFTSRASDLSPLDPNHVDDSYVRDLQTGTTTLVSVNKTGTGSSGATIPVISGNGRYVSFQSTATDLTANDPGNGLDLFVRDLQTATTSLVSVTRAGAGADAHGNSYFFHTMSYDGRFVAFEAQSNNIVENDAGSSNDVFVRDLQTNTTVRASVNAAGTSTGGGGLNPAISSDGRFVAFDSGSTDLTPQSDTNSQGDVYLRDLQAGTTTLVSVNLAGTSAGNVGSTYPVFSGDGRVLVFASSASDIVPNPWRGSVNLYATAVGGRAQFEPATYTASEAAGSFTVTVKRTGATAAAASVNYTTGGGTAAAGSDFNATSGTLDFAPGEETKTFSVTLTDDTTDEFDEAFTLILSDFSQSGGPASLGMALLNITDDDPPPSVTVDDLSVFEGNTGSTNAAYTVRLSAPSAKLVTVNFAPGPNSTAAGNDYTFFSSSVTFNPGSTTQNVVVLVAGDGAYEDDETLTVLLTGATNATLADTEAVINILNDDPVPSVFITDLFTAEGDAGSKTVVFSVNLSNPSSREVSFQYATADATAAAGSDYTGVSGTVSIFPGETTVFIPVQINGDTDNEASEAFLVNLSNPAGANIVRGQAVGTIMNDDSPALVQFGNSLYNASEAAPGTAVINVTRSGDTTGEVTVDYYTFNGAFFNSASDRSDYTLAAGTLRFAAGELSKTFTVFITDDVYDEPTEVLTLFLVNPNGTNGASLGSPAAASILINSDDTTAPTPENNPVSRADFFVRQHYRDFLNRDPDAEGLAFWTNQMTNCGNPNLEVCRVNVSAAFFLSIEFQQTGYLVYRLHGAAFGAGERLPLKTFLTDTQEVGRDVIVGRPGWEDKLAANKQSFLDGFVQRPAFKARYPESMSAAQFVDALNANTGDPSNPSAGGSLTQAERDQLVADLASGAKSRAQVLRAVAESPEYHRRLLNRAFVYMQYVGYLRRGPIDTPDRDFSGYNFWLGKLNEFGGNYVRAEMVKAFINSIEYRQRFGQ